MSLFVLSDVHGYLEDLRDGLEQAGLLDRAGGWAGGDAQLWVLGDLMDRGPDGIGVLRLVRSLQQQVPDQVHMLMGNHEALALGYRLHPTSPFGEVWQANGGRLSDQEGLSDDDVDWMRSLPVAARVGDYLLVHSDTADYLEWGSSVEEVNEAVTSMLADVEDAEAYWEVFASLTSRYAYTGDDGARTAQEVLGRLGGGCIVHGHSIIGSLLGKPSSEIEAPVAYADGLVVAIDGGRYDDGPLLIVQLD